MARKSSSSSRAPAPGVKSAAPAKVQAAPPAPVAAQSGGGFMSSVVSGIASGIGVSMASRAVDSVLGPRQMEVVHKDQGDRCKSYEDLLAKCNNSFGLDCTVHADALRECRSA
jgi:coiled-coil-helix-coiled-coil-helix domain-containing protein 10